jgi:biotin carboxyl carrier protein
MRSEWRDGDRIRVVETTRSENGGWTVVIDDVPIDAHIVVAEDGRFTVSSESRTSPAIVTAAGDRRFVRLGSLDFVLERTSRASSRKRGSAGGGLEAPMPGVVTKVLVGAGDDVVKGQPLLALEAMKMEHMIRAPRDGRVKAILAAQGSMIDGGAALVELEEIESP